MEKSIAAKIGPEKEGRGHASRRPDVIGRSADVQREAWMDFDIHEDARTEGVALGAAPFLMCGWKARREEVRVTVPKRAKPQTWRLVRMGDEREGARIGASPYDPVPRRGDLVKKVCRNVVYHIDSMIG